MKRQLKMSPVICLRKLPLNQLFWYLSCGNPSFLLSYYEFQSVQIVCLVFDAPVYTDGRDSSCHFDQSGDDHRHHGGL